ncbi:MAG: recombination protein RecR [Candidatus Paracaedimonas acanthamoebae]|uniref:Recombination protein RecR n=1 Tax=Candidatus Paracaedimonas acanthamoebae TaxID=244581 RepID=A0A8J7TVX8_9PROT|nr:recombination protein RecR [Candidatus Paracaedimonas acanthamoebae]
MIGSELQTLIQLLAKLPGLGPRSARRVSLHLLKYKTELMIPLSEALHTAAQALKTCEICGNLDTQNPCAICANNNRELGLLCVVESIADLWALERSGSYKGYYHVLGGTLSALDGVGPEQLKIPALLQRVQSTGIREIILALNATVEGQTTSYYLADALKTTQAKITALAHGVPLGGELDYLDDGTLTAALGARRQL